jgi:hypothetical protein
VSDQAAFVEAVILDRDTGAFSVYHPLVVDQGTSPAIAPTPPTLPTNAAVGIWFGSNAGDLTLQGATSTALAAGNCVNGLGDSVMGQYAYCNAPAFYDAANALIASGKIVPPPLGTARDGMACPTSRDFAIVDQDQSDNVVTTYLFLANGTLAQNTAANRATLGTAATLLKNGSDERLDSVLVAGALGCTPWKAPDIGDNGALTPAMALNELFAAARQPAPVALVPILHPFTLVDGFQSLAKNTLYRKGVDMPPLASLAQGATDLMAYCQNLLAIAPPRIKLDQALTSVVASPMPDVATNLYTFLAQRFQFTWSADGLNCAALINKPSPITLVQDANGITTGATITP